MKKYLLLLMFVVGCNADKVELVDETVKLEQVSLGELRIRDTSINGGITERNGDDWYFESHTNLSCVGVLKGACRKADVVAQDGISVTDRIVKYKYTLNVVEYPLIDSPVFVIIFQDWVRLIDGLSNHPITTLKLKNFNGLNLCGYDNSWQFEWGKKDWGHVSDGSIHDHPSEKLNGCLSIYVGVNYDVEFYIYDGGRVKLVVNDVVVYDVEYQTKSIDREHIFSWGLYWNKGYNLDFDPLKRIITTMDNFSRFESI